MSCIDDNLHENMFNNTLWWCLELDSEQVRIKISPCFEKMLGSSVETFDDLLTFMLPDSANLFMSKTEGVLQKIDRRDRFITGFQLENEVKWLINELNHTRKGSVEVFCANCIEVTEMYKLEEKLVQSNSQLMIEQLQEKREKSRKEKELLQKQYKEQTKFLAMLSHELRSPLVGVGSLINVVKKKLSKGESVLDQLKIMRLTIDQLNFLINDILTYSQTQSEHIHINPAPFPLEQMAEYVSHLTKSIANEKGVFVSFSLEYHSSCFYGDLLRISQILINLIVNAIKFTHKGGVIVEVEEKDTTLVFTITDSGEGISDEQLENIFVPFKQLETNGSRQHLGSGLGLPVVKTLVDLLEGEISVESTLGEGTTFKVVLPIEIKPCPKEADQALDEEPLLVMKELDNSHAKSLKVLIADDSIINRKVLEVFLKEVDCEVDHAGDGGDAWQKFNEQDYDFVFLDIQMPVLNGVQVCQKIRALDSSVIPNLKGVFALTAAHTEFEVQQMGIELDKSIFDQWIEKPISEDKVIRALYSELNQRDEISESKISQIVPPALTHLIPQFTESTQKDFEKLRQLLRGQSEKEFKKIAHSLKGNLMLFELHEMVDLVKILETKNLGKDVDSVTHLLDQLERLFAELN